MFRKKSFEIALKAIKNNIDPDAGYLLSSESSINRADLEILKAKELIIIKKSFDNLSKIYLTSKGITYFLDKSDKIKSAILNWTINLVVAILAAAGGSILTLTIQSYLIA